MRTISIPILAALAVVSLGCHPPLETKEKHYVHAGEQAVLSGAGQPQHTTFVAVAKENAHALARAVGQKDTVTLEKMVKDGAVLEIENGTPVKVTAESFNERQVQILDGLQRGRTGWVPFEWLSPPQKARL